MTNPPNKPRDDRRMHEGDKPGLGGSTNNAAQDDVTPERGEVEHHHPERDYPAALDENVTNRSNA